MVVPESLYFYILTENDIIGYFQSAINSVSATGAITNFSISAMKLGYGG